MNRKIPITLATQHPDNAFAPYWTKSSNRFINTHKEYEEAFLSYSDLAIDEYMWDWEGKHTDTSVVYRFFEEKYDYFKTNPLGVDKFLTFRIPNIWVEKGYNLLQALSIILSCEDLAKDLHFDNRPLFEVILPMVENHNQLLHIQYLFQKLAHFKNHDFSPEENDNNEYINIIPLLESCDKQIKVDSLLTKYINGHKKHFGFYPEYLRVFLAGSDSALTSGYLFALIANKIALSRVGLFVQKTNIPVYPILGYGSPVFRGGLKPDTYSINRLLVELPGVRTITLQSSFRYDWQKDVVISAIEHLKKHVNNLHVKIINPDDEKVLIRIGKLSEQLFKKTIDLIIKDIKGMFSIIPKRRDRYQHTGLLSYSRTVNKHSDLPRAIVFTATFYSIGIPPELIGLGRALAKINDKDLDILMRHYSHLKEDLINVGRYLNKDNLKALIKSNPDWKSVKSDIDNIEKIFNIVLRPITDQDHLHYCCTSEILTGKLSEKELDDLIVKASEIRRFLG